MVSKLSQKLGVLERPALNKTRHPDGEVEPLDFGS